MTGPSAAAQVPTGADVVAGQVAISDAGNALNVNAATSRAIVNWDSFSVGAGNVANFNLPDANSAILNRVTSPNMPSTIAGSVNSNGHVYLVNPSGIMVSSSGMVNTNGFTASTFDIGNTDFMNGGALAFADTGSAGSIVNHGTIDTGAGGAHLIASDIANHGTITSTGGNITLSGGGSVTLDNGVTYVQPTMQTLANGISSTAGLIQNTGTIRATGAATSGGEVYLVNPNGNILHDGTIAAHRDPALAAGSGIDVSTTPTASAVGSQGGHVQLEADSITLAADSSIDARGTLGGGEVLVGGDWQGSGTMTQANTVTMEAGATIDVSATESGDGGKIVLWSDVTNADSITKAFGTLVARAGELFGDGGLIETSGATIETDGIAVDAGAANGKGGHWLIDPYNYLIDAVAASNIVSALNTGTSVTVTTTANNASQGSSGNNTDLGDIIVDSDIVTGAMASDATLTLQAHRHINVDANIDATQNGNTAKLNVTLLADSDHSGDGISIVTGDSIKTNGGNLTFGDGSTATIGGSSVQVGGDVYISGTAAQSLETSGGTITVNGETIFANTNGVNFDSAGGDIVFGGVLNSGNQYTGVTSTQTWEGAVSHAKSGNGDQLGDTYLATITSRLENAIAGIAVNYAPSWLGGRRVTGIGTDSSWRWVTGPEGLQDSGNGLIFATGANGATPVGGAFTNWNSGEPNNSGNNETAVQFVGAAGQWNDLRHNSSTLARYVRETNLAPTAVTIDAGTGSLTINGGVGNGKALASLDITSSGTTINGNALITTGAQTYNSAVTATSTIGLQIAGTTLSSSGAFDFTAADNVSLDASLSSTADISITGDQIVLGGNHSINSGSSDLTLNTDDVVDGVLTINTTGHFTYAPNNSAWDSSVIGGQLDYTGTISGDTFTGSSDVDWLKINNYSSLGGLTLGKDGNASHIYVYNPMVINGDVNLIGNRITLIDEIDTSSATGANILLKASGDFVVSATGVELDAGDGDVTVRADTFDWGTLNPTITTTGSLAILPSTDSSSFTHTAVKTSWFNLDPTLGGLQIGHAANTSGITVNTTQNVAGPISLYGGNINLGADLTSTLAGPMNFHGPVVVSSDRVLTAANSDIIFHGTVNSDGTARSLTVNPGTANATFNGNVGGSAALSALTVNGTANVNADITTSGTQNWTGAITIGGSGTRKLSAGTLATQAIVGGSKDVELITDNLNLGGNAASTGSIAIAPKTAGTDIGVGNISGTFSFDNTDFSRLQDGFSSITIGNSASGDLVVGGITALADDLTLRAGSTSDLFVNDALSWSSDDALTLAAGQDIFVNSHINIAGSAAALNLYYGGTNGTSAPTSNTNYYLDVANRKHIRFDEATAGLKIGNESFTLLDSVAGLQGMAVGGRYALTNDLSLAGTTYTDAFYSNTFTGKLDGLGNEVDGLTLLANSGGNYGLFAQLGNASVRHLGVINIDLLGQSTSNNAADDLRIGGIAGNVSGTGTNLLDGVWATGVIATKQGSLQDVFYAGGLAGGHDSGTLNIVRSFSTVNVSSQGSHSQKMGLGGLLGDSGDHNGLSSIGGPIAHLMIDRSYAIGSIVEGNYAGYYGSGGLVGVGYGESVTVKDSFSQSNVVGGISSGGLVGVVGNWGTYNLTRNYTTLNRFGNGVTPTQSYKSDTLAAATNNGTQLPSGWSSDIWTVGDLPTLKAVGVPAALLYVKVISGTGIYGDSITPTYQIVDADGNLISFGTGDYSNLDGVAGTGRYTLGQFTNAGTYNSVSYLSGLGLTGDDANLYALNPFTTAGSYTITPRSITAALSNTGVTKVYDGTTSGPSGFTPTYTFGNLLSGDSATINYSSLLFNSKDVTAADTLTMSGMSLAGITGSNGSLISDYVLSATSSSLAATITAKPIFIGNVFASDKVYDGTTSVTIDDSGATLSGLVGGDSLTLGSVSGEFVDKNAGTGKTVNLTGVIGGADVANYSGSSSSTTTANITQKAVTVSGFTGQSRVYDGTTAATLDTSGVAFNGILSGDELSVSGATGSFADKNAGTNKTINISGATFGGSDVGNYAITNQAATTADITAKSLTVELGAFTGKVYDGTTSLDLTGVTPTLTGIVSGDTVTIGSGTISGFSDKNVGTNKAVDYSGFSISGTDAPNYAVSLGSAQSTAAITAKSITVSGITGVDRTYDGTTSATVDTTGVTFNGMISGDALSASGTTGVFADKNAGTGKTITLSGTSYGGADVGNYDFTDQASTTADVAAKSVTVSGITAADRVYDGTTTVT
ncbi:MAG: YDG domain-containing protein, partial [Rubripirellula sp.]